MFNRRRACVAAESGSRVPTLGRLGRAYLSAVALAAPGGVGDAGFLFLIYFLSSILYVGQLGFYSDDWSPLALYDLRGDRSVWSVIDYMLRNSNSARPVQYLWSLTLYETFGFAPLGYHIAKSAILLANALLFYLCLRELHQPRVVTIAVPAIYITLPNYSTVHFWIAASQAAISMGFYFASLYWDLLTLRANRVQVWALRLASAGALIGSSLSYECAILLFLLNPFLLWQASKQHAQIPSSRARHFTWSLLATNLVLIGLVSAYKIIITVNLISSIGIAAEGSGHLLDRLLYNLFARTRNEQSVGFNLWQFIDIDLFERGLKLPLLAFKATKYVRWPELAATGVLCVLGSVYLGFVLPPLARSQPTGFARPREWLLLSAAGLISALAGYGIFVIVTNIHFTIAGNVNRVSMAAAAGIAVFLVGVIGYMSCDLPTERIRRTTFAVLAGLFMASGCMVNYAIASHWTAAYHRETEILTAIRARFPTLPKGATFILDGTCPYIGPAIVFESNWDLAGALALLYRDPDLKADVVTPQLEIMQDGLRTTIYGEHTDYPYGLDLIIYDVRRDVARRLSDRQSAEAYFSEVSDNVESRCVWGHTSIGVPIF